MSENRSPGHQGVWLALAVPVLLIGVFVVGFSGQGTKSPDHSGDCLPDMPSNPASPGHGSGSVVWPIAAGHREISSPFGPRDGGFHSGIDLAAPQGTPILAATDGTVLAAGHADGFGNWIVLDATVDGHKISTVYGHMYDDGVLVHTGQKITAGQHIANVGANGEATGPHLHFEVWNGGRLSGGTATDPLPWLTQHAGPITATTPESAGTDLAAADSGGDAAPVSLPPVPSSVGSEIHLQVDTIRVMRAIHQHFPQITSIGGWRAADPYPDHPSGRAADIMIPGWDSPDGKALGEKIVDYLMGHAEDFSIVYTIFRRIYHPATGAPNEMEDRGSATENHMNHVHVTVQGHGYPQSGQTYIAPPDTTTTESGCSPAQNATGARLRPGAVPAAFVPWIERASHTCQEVTAPLIAAQLKQESGFDPDAYNPTSQATGAAQFIPSTWASEAIDADGTGNKDPHSIPDAVMTQASYDCKLAATAKTALAQGRLHGDLTQLWLSMYNCGPQATLGGGEVCQNPQTLGYVTNIPAMAAQLADPDNTDVLAGAPR